MNTFKFLMMALLLSGSEAQAQHLLAWPMLTPVAQRLPPPVLHPPVPVEAPIAKVPPAVVVTPRPTALPLPPAARALPVVHRGLEGRIDGDVAHLTLEVRFSNQSRDRLEGELFVPVPQDAVFDSLEMRVGDKVMKAELLEAKSARTTYEGIVRQLRDPALLELVNEHLLRARVFPIEPHSEVRLRFSYVQAVPKEGNLRTLRIPVVHFADSGMKKDQRVLDLTLKADKPIRQLYSPSHKLEVQRSGEREARVWYGGEDQVQEKDLILMYSVDDGPLAVSLSAFRSDEEDGTFLLSLDPKAAPGAAALPKDLVFVLDRSASMDDDGKLVQLREAMKYCVGRLSPEDRFTIVDFGSGVRTFSERLLEATPKNVSRGRDYVSKLEATGATNIDGALVEALRLLHRAPGRLPLVVFITDGRPTVGETDPKALLESYRARRAGSGARFFGLGIGPDVNTSLMDQLADLGKGGRDYVLPGEDLQKKVARFFDRIALPALTDVKVEWKGGGVTETYPRETADVFYGDPLTLAGRYAKDGPATLVVTGNSGATPVRYEIPVVLPAEAKGNSYLPRLWAYRKVAQLMDDVRLSRTVDRGATEEIVALAQRYGIVTPYTSYLIAEDKDLQQARRLTEAGLQAMAADARGEASDSPIAPEGGAGERRFAR